MWDATCTDTIASISNDVLRKQGQQPKKQQPGEEAILIIKKLDKHLLKKKVTQDLPFTFLETKYQHGDSKEKCSFSNEKFEKVG